MEQNYEEMLAIDPHALDNEWLKQPLSFFRVAQAAADQRRDVDKAKESVDVIDAELARDIRARPENFGMEKVTEGGIQMSILLQPRHQKASAALIEMRHDLEVLVAAVRSFDQRKDALENLVRLHGQNYYAEPDSDPETVKAIRESGKKNMRRKINDALNKGKED